MESDTLVGDFLNLTVTLEGRTDTYCRFSVKELYNEYQEYGWERVDFIISENIKLASFYSPDEIMKNITDYEFIRNRLIVRPINFTDNKYELKDCVYKKIGDIALVLYVLLYDDEKMGLGTVKAQKAFIDKWEKDYGEIWEDALRNTNVWAPPRMYMRAEDLIDPPYTQGAFMAFGYKLEKINPLFAPTITTVKKKNWSNCNVLSWSIRETGRNLWRKLLCIIYKYSRCTNSPCINSAAETDSSFFKRCK